ncbi:MULTISPECIES: hypothetical protein [Streptomyces]|uniref:hypothetical protein n=1 Tax=Streptomyces TaxID=1883 RepID=UPI001D13557E|nr:MULTISPECIES: hypothetical protein [Streptomyces]MCC3654957.1 hypothetical protein [Streptomyces sp. S07_1.15]WSQ70710.1 hypothetical protein OG463_04175 [Streptomyces xinghaiensis]
MAPRGTAGLLRLVAFLVRRPRPRDRRLPLIWLTGPGSPAALRTLRGRLAAPPKRRVPHAWAEAGRPAGELPVLPLLNQLRAALSVQTFGGDRLWFRHFGLLSWLLGQDVSGVDSDAVPGELVRRLRQRRRLVEEPAAAQETAGQFGALYHLVWQLLRKAVPAALFRAAVSGRIPGIGRQYRWFMRQHYLAPAQSGTFPAFAERLTAGARRGEDPAQLNRLLVHAFLEDLRRAYARPPWRVRGWRRTAYPVALILGGPSGDTGDVLLGLLNDVRNETGRWDPLLAVYATERPAEPAGTGPLTTAGLAGLGSGDADEEWGEWEEELDHRRHARADRAWFLLLRTGRDEGTAHEPAGGPSGIKAPGPPWFARRTLAVAVCLVLLAPGAVWTGRWLGGPDCLHAPFSGEVSVRSLGGECVGYSDDSGFKFNDQPGQENLRRVQERIFEQNREARDIWERSGRRRPYVTLVYLGTLTGRSTKPNEEAYAAEREELEGLAVAQYEGVLEAPSTYSAPLVRVVVANAGFQMRYADAAVSMIADLAREESDAPVAGVIGLVESRRSTAEALKRLNRAGLPAIAPTLSGDGMDRHSKLYLQMAAPNRDQAEMIAAYARGVLRVRGVRVYYTHGERSSLKEDYYVSTLLDDLRAGLGGELLDGEPSFFGSGDDLSRECGYPGMLFFAGRWSEFNGFLQALRRSCGNNPPRHLVADDSVNRYMANPELRKGAPGTVPLTYVSKAAPATCEALETRVRRQRDEAADRFLRSVREEGLLSPPRCLGRGDADDRVGERVGLAYDSAGMLLRAVETLVARVRAPGQPWDPHAINPAAVHAEVLHQNYVNPYYGATGSTVYGTTGRGEPTDKRISLLRVEKISDRTTPPVEVFHCGAVRKGDDPACARARDGSG